MKRPRLVAGLIILIVLTLVMIAGAFAIGRYQKLANATFSLDQSAKAIDNKTSEQFASMQTLDSMLHDTTLTAAFSRVKNSQPRKKLEEDSTTFVTADTDYQKEAANFLTVAGNVETLATTKGAADALGAIYDITNALTQQKRDYNDLVARYEATRTRFPEFISTALGFESKKRFTITQKPLERPDEKNDLNSFN